MTRLLLVAGVVLPLMFLVVAGYDIFATKNAKRRTLKHLDDFESITVASVRKQELAIPLRQRVVQPGLRRLARFAQTFTPIGVIQRLDDVLIHGGVSGWDGPRLLAVKILGTAIGAFAGLVGVPLLLTLTAPAGASGGLGQVAAQGSVFAVVFAIIGYYLPEWIARGRASERSRDIQKTLPDALDLLSISVTAGLGFEAALDRVAREMRGELGIELYRVVQEMRLGQGRAEALKGLSARTDVPELDSFVLSMVQAEAFGVPIARVLSTQADEMRLKRRQRAEETAMKIPVKILFPLILCIFPVLFIVILGPAGITIANNILADDVQSGP